MHADQTKRGGLWVPAWTVVSALLGLIVWILMGAGRGIGMARWSIIAVGGAIAALPPVSRRINAFGQRVKASGMSHGGRWTLALFAVSTLYFILTAFLQDRDLFPKTHDDCSYAIGMQILARGRLWMPPLPLPDFFDSFYILVRPVYCSLYFPGTSLLFVPTVWLHLPTWLMPAMASGCVVALSYRVISELIDPMYGVLAALLVASLSWFRVYSILLTSHLPMLMFGLLLFWVWLRWRKGFQLRWALAMGAIAGWAAITRPADALIIAVPIAIASLISLLRQRPRRWLVMPAAAIIAAAPFLALQVIFDLGVTGHALSAPYGYYLERDQPGSAFGFYTYNPAAVPESPLLQKQENYDRFVRKYLVSHTPANTPRVWARQYFPMIVDTTMPARLMIVFAAIGAFVLFQKRYEARDDGVWLKKAGASNEPSPQPSPSGRGSRRLDSAHPPLPEAEGWGEGAERLPATEQYRHDRGPAPRIVLAATIPLFIIVYAINPFFLEHYALLLIPAVSLLVLLGGRALAQWRPEAGSAFIAIVFIACLTGFWEINRLISPPETAVFDETFPSVYLRLAHDYLPDSRFIQQPAVVLFTYHSGDDFFQEPVYNTDVAWPDNAPIIRAHDLGPVRNREIFAYYARIQPSRTFYRFDFATEDKLTRLGTARELADGNVP